MSVNFELIGSRIQQKRKKIKKTQENLAEYLDVSVGYISLVERGKTKVSLSTLSKISDYLSCSIGSLVDNTSDSDANYLNKEICSKINQLDNNEREILFKLIDAYLKAAHNK